MKSPPVKYSCLTSVLLVAWALSSGGLPAFQEKPAESKSSRVRIVTQTSDERLEDILESADGTRLITHDRGYAPRLWDRKTMRLLKVLSGQADNTHFVTFSPNSKTILCLAEVSAMLWDSRTAKSLGVLFPPKDMRFRTAAFSPDNKTLAISTIQGPIFLMDLDKAGEGKELKGHDNDVRALEYSPNGKYLIAGDMNRIAKIWDVATGTVKWDLGDQGHGIPWAHFSKDSKHALVSSYDSTALLYDVDTGRQLWKKRHAIGDKGMAIRTHMGAIFVGKTKPLALLSDDQGTMSLYDPETGNKVKDLKGHTMALREIRGTADGTKVATYGDDNQLKIWDVESGKELPFPHRSNQETAGEFSPDGRTWWLGHKDGSITAHDVLTGAVRSETLGAVQNMSGAFLTATDRGLWTQLHTYQVLWNTQALNERVSVVGSGTAPELSADARRMLTYSPRSETGELTPFPLVLRDVATRKYIQAYKECEGARFSADSNLFVTWKKTGDAYVWNASDGTLLNGWQWNEKLSFSSCAIAPDGKTVASVGGATEGFILFWNIATGKTTESIPLVTGHPRDVAYSPDGRVVAVVGDAGVQVFNSSDMKTKFSIKDSFFSDSRLVFNKDGSKLAMISSFQLAVWDVESEFQLIDERIAFNTPVLTQGRFSPDGKKILTFAENRVVVCNLEFGQREALLLLSDEVNCASFTPDGKRILTVDNTEGLTIWDATKPKPERLGNFVVMKDGDWLVYDTEGRFDANDIDEADAAHFVMEWSEGLEPIALKQLKGQFYDPGLLAKLLGQSKEPPRPVPNLESLRLYPELTLRPSAADPMSVQVSLKERDEGGMGKMRAFLNGKEIFLRPASGFFKLDVRDYQQFMLPQTFLPEGRGNVLSITASNEKGDLWSLPVSVDIGVPQDLRAPEVRLFALCVGVGDYVGTSGDLLAPSSDARALSKAIAEAAERLLPKRVNLTLLTTDAERVEDRPTRERVLRWFDETSKSSSSTDIVFVFFAGHGMSSLGEQRGYFFLTAEADPGDMSESGVSTSTISGDVLKDKLAKIPANKQVVILDTCHSGAAAGSLLGAERSLSGDYQRAWEAIKDSTGVWMLAGSAADQRSYESANVEHGMLTYALLEAIDRATGEGLRAVPSGELFIDVEKWLGYAAGRVESLKNEIGLGGVQRPEFKRSPQGKSFDLGVTNSERRGALQLKAPRPIVIVGSFQTADREDPANLEPGVKGALKDSAYLKPWFDISKHPNVYRVEGEYTQEGDSLKLKVFLQIFDSGQTRKTLETFEVTGSSAERPKFVATLRAEVEARVRKHEELKAKAPAATDR